MGNVANLPSNNDAFSESELKAIAMREYITKNDRHLGRIVKLVNKPLEVVNQWKLDGEWAAKRAEYKRKTKADDIQLITQLLSNAGVPSSRDAAISTLKACEKAARAVDNCLDKTAQHSAPEYLDKVLSAMERIEKLRKDAYSRL